MADGKLQAFMRWLRLDWLAPLAASNRMLREQYDVTIRVYACVARGEAPAKERLQTVEQIPKNQRTWSDLYEMEMLLTRVDDEAQTRRELARRLVEARKRFGDDYVKQYDTVTVAATTTPALIADVRAALLRLVNDLLWTDTKEEASRRLFACVTARACICFIVCTLLFLWRASKLLNLCDGGTGESFAACVMFGAAVTGAWGATFSMLWSTKIQPQSTDLDRLKVIVGYWQTIARPLVGAGCGIILYLAILGGFITGSVFPTAAVLDQPHAHVKTEAPKDEDEAHRQARENAENNARQKERDELMKGLALLALWCFVAGFSERLVMGVLERAGNTPTGGATSAAKAPGS